MTVILVDQGNSELSDESYGFLAESTAVITSGENFRKISGNCPRKISQNFRKISGNCPRKISQNFPKIFKNFQKMFRNFHRKLS